MTSIQLGTIAAAHGAGGAEPPTSGLVLFDGTSLDEWVGEDGGEPRWRLADGHLEIVPGTGDLRTRRELCDFQLHLEFWLPEMPGAEGQARANSGVFLQ